MVNGNLPDEWTTVTVGELAERVTKGSTPTSYGFKYQREGINFVKTENIGEDGIIKNITDYIDDETNKFLSRSILQPYDILFSIAGTIGRVGIVQEKDIPANTNQALAILRGLHKKANHKFVYYYLKSPFIQKQALNSIVGVGRANLSLANISSFEIPLPPLPEQERIVSRIEELFSDLEAGVAALERVRAGLKRYKASVLKAACEGKLFGDVELGDDGLPTGWRWTTVGEIGEISGGLTKNSKRDALKKKMPYLRVANVYANELQLDDVSEIGVEEKEIKRALLQDGDLLVVEGNGSPDQIGRVAIWNGSISPCLHQNHIIKVRFEPKEVAEYVLYWLLSESGREQITNVASSTSGLYTLSLSKVSNLPVPLPPLEEQRRIVAEVERRLSVVGEVESVVEAGLARASRLRQAVLRSAFEGRL